MAGKSSAAELLSRMSGKKKLEPSARDVLEEHAAASRELRRLKAARGTDDSSQKAINAAWGAQIQWEDKYKFASGDKFRQPPELPGAEHDALVDLCD